MWSLSKFNNGAYMTNENNNNKNIFLNDTKHSENAANESGNNETATVTTDAKQEKGTEVFDEVFSALGDHSGFYIAQYHICDLPYIFLEGNSLRFYKNKTDMLNTGLYTEKHHKIVNKETDMPVQLDLSVTNLVVFQWLAMAVVLGVFKYITRKSALKPNKAPKGFLANVVEKMVMYIRDEVVIANFESRKIADKLTYYFVATCIFILVINLCGFLPGGHTATAAIPVTASLAIVAFFVINGYAIKYSGIGAWFKHFLGGAPIFLAPIMIPIELMGLIIKPFSLTVRLFANMAVGHIVLFALLGLLFYFNTYFLALVIVPFSIFILLLELLVLFIQAFVFTMLVSIYTSQSIGSHSHSE